MTTILIVDDDSIIRKLLNNVFKGNDNYKVAFAETSHEAFENLTVNEYDILLLDGNLEGISGFEFLKYTKIHYPLMEVIIISGNTDMIKAINSLKDGAFDYIEKPFTQENIIDTVERALVHKKTKEKDIVQKEERLEESILPDYKFVRTIGAGAMGFVSLMENRNNPADQKALKILKDEEMEDMSQDKKIARFLRESEIMKDIDNLNVVKIYKSCIYKEKTSYILMEYVDGSSLKNFINKNNLDLKEKILIIKKIAIALDVVHRKGVLHRDLKPDNIVLTKELEPKLLDFGIARVANSDLTMNYEILGSPAYLPPEAFEVSSSKLNEQGDIFSLGVLSYELLTGQKPFLGDTIVLLTNEIQNSKPIHPSKINKEVTERMSMILAKMLEKKLEDRYLSCLEIVKDIEELNNPKRTMVLKRILRKIKPSTWRK